MNYKFGMYKFTKKVHIHLTKSIDLLTMLFIDTICLLMNWRDIMDNSNFIKKVSKMIAVEALNEAVQSNEWYDDSISDSKEIRAYILGLQHGAQLVKELKCMIDPIKNIV